MTDKGVVKYPKDAKRGDPWKQLREKTGVTVKETAKR
jgi:hypothetical protein